MTLPPRRFTRKNGALRSCRWRLLDLGSGLPTMDNVHEVARRVIPGAAVVYVDNDRVALTHANALLATSDGVAAVFGDLREPDKILADAAATGTIDLSRPLVVRASAGP